MILQEIIDRIKQNKLAQTAAQNNPYAGVLNYIVRPAVRVGYEATKTVLNDQRPDQAQGFLQKLLLGNEPLRTYQDPERPAAKIEQKTGIPAEGLIAAGILSDVGVPGVDDAARRGVVQTAGELQKFEGAKNLTTKVLDRLIGTRAVAPETIVNLSKDTKQAEQSVIMNVLNKYMGKGKVPIQQFADDVEGELLPLSRDSAGRTASDFGYSGDYRYENINLPAELRGNVANYSEHVYQSPIKTSAGNVHFQTGAGIGQENRFGNYFAHTRVEDLADTPPRAAFGNVNGREALVDRQTGELIQYINSPEDFNKFQELFHKPSSTRRVIEIQSDLFQKGRYNNELEVAQKDAFIAKARLENGEFGNFPEEKIRPLLEDQIRESENLAKLKPYENTWHERVIREEVKKAAQDGKTKLQFPTGETAMQIEGLGVDRRFNHWITPQTGRQLQPAELKIGKEVEFLNNEGVSSPTAWIITDVLGDGKFKAVPKNTVDEYAANGLGMEHLGANAEQFDISGKVDTSNPIYKFYESEVGKYLNKKYNAKRIKDPQGVEWWELDVKPEQGKAPIEAFAFLPFLNLSQYENNETQR